VAAAATNQKQSWEKARNGPKKKKKVSRPVKEGGGVWGWEKTKASAIQKNKQLGERKRRREWRGERQTSETGKGCGKGGTRKEGGRCNRGHTAREGG